MLTTVETFEQLIRHQSTAQLLPFLLELEKSDIVAIRQKTKALHRELNAFKDLGNGRWGSASTPEQNRMLFLAGLKTYSRKEALGGDFGIWQLEPQHRAAFWRVLENARPAWLLDWLLRWVDTMTWQLPDYQLLRELESRQLIAYHPRLFALSLVGLLAETGNRLSQATPVPASALDAIADEFRRDTKLLIRDLPLLFDFDSGVANTQARVQLPMSANQNWLVAPLTWQTWHEAHPAQLVTWADLVRHLAATGALDRADLLTRCLLALRRDFRRPLLIWFKELFSSLRPTLTERLARQSDLVELLAHPLPLVVNFALEQLKNMWTEPGFDLAPLLLYADNLLTRPDLKTGLKTLLTGLGRLPKHDATQAPAVARLIAAALAHPDNQVQEHAAKHLAELLKAKKSLLTAAETAETGAAIGQQAELLGAAARKLLAPWLPDAATTTPAIYAPIAQFSPVISPATAIAPVADWHELLFLTGQVLRHDDPVAQERWLAGLLRLRDQLPADYARQLQPYLVQYFPWLVKNKTEEEALAELMQHSFSPESNTQRELVQALLLGWATGFRRPKVRQIAFSDHQYHHNADPLLLAERQRLAEVEAQMRAPAAPVGLLSTPTHAPHWVAPSALVQRLLTYEAAHYAPNPADLTLALARTAWAAEADAALARPLLARLGHPELRELLAWFLAPATALGVPLPATALSAPQPAGFLHKLLFFKASPPDPLAAALPWLWAVAARTRRPDAVLDELRPLADYPGLAEAWQPGWRIEPQSQTHQSYRAQQPATTHTWQELRVPTEHAGQVPPSPLLLYSQHARLWQDKRYYLWPLQANLPFLLAMLPNNPAPLHWHVLRTACRTTGQHAEGSEVVQLVLRSLLAPGPAFGAPTTALLAAGLTHQAAACRFLALEVLLAAVASGRLMPAALGHDLGRLLAAGFAPLARLADLLPQAQGTSPVADDALGQLLDALLPQLPAAPLRNLRKLLDLYSDLAARSGRPMPTAVQAQVLLWQAAPALKKASALLLA
ncbi:DUF6493 family protein [Hymenobacter bucti]|uniref:DUF6493 family protein n=1 Tax=Hymenobacter bucti TaxID=1844114 RepID=A0ABW4QTT8_9BACT